MRHRQLTFARPSSVIGLAALIGCTALPAFASESPSLHSHAPITAPGSSNAATARQKAFDQTHALVALQKKWAKAKGAEKSRALEQMVAKAEERHVFLLELMENNPAAVLSAAIPDEKQVGMPAAVLEKLEQRVELEGELEVFYEDYEDGSHKLRHVLKTPFGEKLEVFHAKLADAGLNQGQTIKAKGLLLQGKGQGLAPDGAIALSDQSLLAEGNEFLTAEHAAAELPYTLGEQKTLVMLVNFQDNPIEPWQHDEVRNVIFTQASNFMLANSFQQTWLSGDVAGWYTLPLSSSSCDVNAITTAAQDAAKAQGIDVTAYDRQVYAFPYTSACKWSGLGSVGGKPSGAWLNGSMRWTTVSHEIGHNFGLHHSHALECGNTATGTGCSKIEYGDLTDVMGQSATQYTSFQKELLGWLDYSDIQTVVEDGSYSLDLYATQKNGVPKALKVQKSVDATTGDKEWYYIEYRHPTGYDKPLMYQDNLTQGVVVHSGSEASRNTSNLLDMTPSSQAADWSDAALEVGNQYTDINSGITISTDWIDDTKATVSIRGVADTPDSGNTCVQATPSLTLSSNNNWVEAGTPVSYSLTLTNNDSAGCPVGTFVLNAQAPSGWSAALGSTQPELAPGSSLTTTLSVTSPATATDGFYEISVQAGNGTYSDNDTVTYVIDTPEAINKAPVAVNDVAGLSSKSAVTVPVMGNDWDPEGAPLKLVSATQGNKGSVRLNADGTLTYTPGKRFKNSDAFSYTITDGQISASATVSVQLDTSTGDSTGDTGGGNSGKGNGKGPNK